MTDWYPTLSRVDVVNCPAATKVDRSTWRGWRALTDDQWKKRIGKARVWEDEHLEECEICRRHFEEKQRKDEEESQRAEEACYEREQGLSGW